MINNISMKKSIISKIFHIVTIFQLAILGANYLIFSPSFCPTSLIELSGVVSVAVFVIVLLFVRPTKCVKFLCLVFIIFGIVIGIYYFGMLHSKAIIFDGHIYIKGDQLIEKTKEFLEKNPSVTEKKYFDGTGRDQSLVWTKKSLSKNTWILGGLYFSFVGFLGFGIFGGLEISKFCPVAVYFWRNSQKSKNKREKA